VDGTPEVVRHNVTGKLVAAGDSRALAAALLALLRDRDLARRLGEAGRDHALNRFDLRTQVEGTARVYRRLAGVEDRLAA
ncbi:MAG: glycosyltransferase, partial [Candidatus Rokuibacteriota bacterium]